MDAADLYQEIFDRLSSLGDAEVFLMSGGSVFGMESFSGLRLIANSLCQAYGIDGAGRLSAPDKTSLDRLDEAGKALTELVAGCGLSFVLCYHFSGTSEWNLAYSDDLGLDGAREELIHFVHGGIDMSYVG